MQLTRISLQRYWHSVLQTRKGDYSMKDVIIAYWKEKDPEFEFDMSWLDKLLANLRPEQKELLMTKSVDLETLQVRELLHLS